MQLIQQIAEVPGNLNLRGLGKFRTSEERLHLAQAERLGMARKQRGDEWFQSKVKSPVTTTFLFCPLMVALPL